MPFKEYLPGTVELYSWQVTYKSKGEMYYMNVLAENEEEAKTKVRKLYENEIEIHEISMKVS
ncbi:MAG TPA: hypothetical protein VK071_04365 [Tissierellales bacterium]|nr:hypothetical protein [Tissierellales bacterium]